MARAKLPASIPGTFFVLRYDKDRDVMSIWMNATDSHSIGEEVNQHTGESWFNPTAGSHQLQRWGVEKFCANDAIDQALEFRSVQVIPAERRVINLLPRGSQVRDAQIVHAFAVHDEQPRNSYAYL